jgi:type I restriction enzyme R subunit
LSQIIERLNDIFETDDLTEKDMVNYAYTITDKLRENMIVVNQVANNSPELAMLGDFKQALDDAIIDSSEAHQNQMMQLLANPDRAEVYSRLIFDLLRNSDDQR